MELATIHNIPYLLNFPKMGLTDKSRCKIAEIAQNCCTKYNQTVKELVEKKKKNRSLIKQRNILFLLGKCHIHRQVAEFNTAFLYCSLLKRILDLNRCDNVSCNKLSNKFILVFLSRLMQVAIHSKKTQLHFPDL